MAAQGLKLGVDEVCQCLGGAVLIVLEDVEDEELIAGEEEVQVAELCAFIVVHLVEVEVVVSVALDYYVIQQEVHVATAHLHFPLPFQPQQLKSRHCSNFDLVLCYLWRLYCTSLQFWRAFVTLRVDTFDDASRNMVLIDDPRIQFVLLPVEGRQLGNSQILFFEIVQLPFVSELQHFHGLIELERQNGVGKQALVPRFAIIHILLGTLDNLLQDDVFVVLTFGTATAIREISMDAISSHLLQTIVLTQDNSICKLVQQSCLFIVPCRIILEEIKETAEEWLGQNSIIGKAFMVVKVFLDEVQKLILEDVGERDESVDSCDGQPVIVSQQVDDVIEVRGGYGAMIGHQELCHLVFDDGLFDLFEALRAFDGELRQNSTELRWIANELGEISAADEKLNQMLAIVADLYIFAFVESAEEGEQPDGVTLVLHHAVAMQHVLHCRLAALR